MVKRAGDIKKYGFSLAEVLISMLIMSLFFLAFSKVITKKHTTEFQKFPHGYFECYQLTSAGEVHSRLVNFAGKSYERTGRCKFIPPQTAQVYNIHYIDQDTYFNTVESMFNKEIDIPHPSGFSRLVNQSLIPDDEEEMKMGANMFWTYLQKSHPTSIICGYMGSTGLRPLAAVFISW